MTRIYRTEAFLPLSWALERSHDEAMVLAIVLSAGFVGVLFLMGWLADRLLDGRFRGWVDPR